MVKTQSTIHCTKGQRGAPLAIKRFDIEIKKIIFRWVRLDFARLSLVRSVWFDCLASQSVLGSVCLLNFSFACFRTSVFMYGGVS